MKLMITTTMSNIYFLNFANDDSFFATEVIVTWKIFTNCFAVKILSAIEKNCKFHRESNLLKGLDKYLIQSPLYFFSCYLVVKQNYVCKLRNKFLYNFV